MNQKLATDIIEEFNGYFKNNYDNSVINLDFYLKNRIDFQIQDFADAVRIYGGNIPPNRFFHYFIAIVTHGYGIKTVGLKEFQVKPNTLIFTGAHVIHSSRDYTQDTKGYIISFSKDFLLVNHANKNFLDNLSFFKILSQPFLYINDPEKEDLLILFKNIATEYLNNNEYKEELIRLYIFEILIKVERIYLRQFSFLYNEDSSQRFISEFKQLIELNFLTEKSVSFYARMLSVHPNHLNATVKKDTGKTCSEWIHERVILEAKCLLQSTNLSIKEISAYLSFEDSSYFSKYFKKLTDYSPLEYKEKYGI